MLIRLVVAIVLCAGASVGALACSGQQNPDGYKGVGGANGSSEPFAGLRLNGTNATGMALRIQSRRLHRRIARPASHLCTPIEMLSN
jgi:hypothetical protein